jgi:hypothetical protein
MDIEGKTYLFGNIEVGVVQRIRTLVSCGISGDLGAKLENVLLPGNDANYF